MFKKGYTDRLITANNNIGHKRNIKMRRTISICSNNGKGGGHLTISIIYVTLVHFMDTLRNVNHAVRISGAWIYYSNYNKALPFVRESLYIISEFLDDDNIAADLESVFMQ